ncbi:unnamed protein product [Rotaria magnacalcarata]|uniref:Rap-GAP domain-containing protein n=1 Tax=Rotaria magnacalcarata TaxID=392030 RepID=A0A815JQD4_9BILA|nr:unnamed protein product [Rotaria magnacalcarata]CAF3877951.1 unnamed protein product [Rotaria magnacalcarata]
MSIAPKDPAPVEAGSFKSHAFINFQQNKPLKSTLSHAGHDIVSRNSLKTMTITHRLSHAPSLRTRALSSTEEVLSDSVPGSRKLEAIRDKRLSESKLPVEKDNPHLPIENRNSSATKTHLNSLLLHGLPFTKHHPRATSKDETNITNNNNIVSMSACASQCSDPPMTKLDAYLQLKPPIPSANPPRLPPFNSSEQLLATHNEDSTSSPPFILDDAPIEPRSGTVTTADFHGALYVADNYHKNFYDYFHVNYYGELDGETPFIASLRIINYEIPSKDASEARMIVRIPDNNYIVSEKVTATNENNLAGILIQKLDLSSSYTLKSIGDPKANEKIHLFDKINDERCNCKIGVLYQRVNQTVEQDIFNNDILPNDMLDFLNRISERVDLKGFTKYRGDLDTKNGSHGEYSYYAQYKYHEIMFNVAPMIASANVDERYTVRKGLVGNAFVCVVYQEQGANFSPDFISGKVTHIYITVQPFMANARLQYKIGIWHRSDIKNKISPTGGVLICDESFCSYFLTLLLNSIDDAIKSQNLRGFIFEQRRRLKLEELKKLSHSFSIVSIPDVCSETDSVSVQSNLRTSTRTESFTSNTTATTNDSITPHNGRISPAHPKKKGFSKIFGVFTNRSGSVPSTTYTPTYHVNDEGVSGSTHILSIPEGQAILNPTTLSTSKESIHRPRSTKTEPAPLLLPRTTNPNTFGSVRSISLMPTNKTVLDSSTETNLINTAALDIIPRTRSNSSPEHAVNTNKAKSLAPTRTVQKPGASSSDDSDASGDAAVSDSEV